MKNLILSVFALALANIAFAQTEKEKVERACLNYLEGFYEGDTLKLQASLKPELYKIGFWKKDANANYESDGQMTYRQALNYAKRVRERKSFAKSDAPKKIEVLDVLDNIAAAKVTAWWGYDYCLLSKHDDKWMIEQVLWEGPYRK